MQISIFSFCLFFHLYNGEKNRKIKKETLFAHGKMHTMNRKRKKEFDFMIDIATAHACIQNFLKKPRPGTPISVNERSLEVFGNEKYLASAECKKLLHKNHLSFSLFNVYETPEPFFYYHCHNFSGIGLIVENKDTWYSMRKILMKTGQICGLPVQALIYGEGRKIQKSFQYIAAEDTKDIHNVKTFYYFGDMDSSGIDILYKIVSSYPEHSILPFKPGYEYLYCHRMEGRTKELEISIPISMKEVSILDFFDEHCLNDIYTFCNHDYIIPQELLNYHVLDTWNLPC